jgi:small subunit ribosomal protein S17e
VVVMGRIRGSSIKKLAMKLLKVYPDRFSTDFEQNKQVLKELGIIDSKRIRNRVAGYIVRLKKREEAS